MNNTLHLTLLESLGNAKAISNCFVDLSPHYCSSSEELQESNLFIDNPNTDFKTALLEQNWGNILCPDEKDLEEQNNYYEKIRRLSSVDFCKSTEQSSKENGQILYGLKEKKPIFKVHFPYQEKKKDSLFTSLENNVGLYEILDEKEEKYYLQRKRYSTKRRRKNNTDNILKKIKRRFLNHALIGKLNKLLKSNGSRFFLEKFPQSFASDVKKENNQKILDMTLKEIFETKELYKNELDNYNHNLKVVKSDDVKKNEEFQKIMNKKYYQLFEEYLNSKEFKIDEIDRLKKNNMNDDSIKRYLCLAKHFIEHFSQ